MILRQKSGSIQRTLTSSSRILHRTRWCSSMPKLVDHYSTLSSMLTTRQLTQVTIETMPEERLESFLSGSPMTSKCNGRPDKLMFWDKNQLTAPMTIRLATKLVLCLWFMRPAQIQDIPQEDRIWQFLDMDLTREILPQRLTVKTVLSPANLFTHSHARYHQRQRFLSLTQTMPDLMEWEEGSSMKPTG